MAKRKQKKPGRSFEERIADLDRRKQELALRKQLADLRAAKK